MTAIPTAANTRDQLLVAFERGFDGLRPEISKRIRVQQRLEPFRERILARREQGYSWQQIVDVLKRPEIGIHTSVAMLRRVFAAKPRQPRKQAKIVIRALPMPDPSRPTAGKA